MITIAEQLILGVAIWFVVASVTLPLLSVLWRFVTLFFKAISP